MSANCPIKQCPAATRATGCGFYQNGLQCRHPVYRDDFARCQVSVIEIVFTAISEIARAAWNERAREVVQGRLL